MSKPTDDKVKQPIDGKCGYCGAEILQTVCGEVCSGHCGYIDGYYWPEVKRAASSPVAAKAEPEGVRERLTVALRNARTDKGFQAVHFGDDFAGILEAILPVVSAIALQARREALQAESEKWKRAARKAVCPRCAGDSENDGMPTLRGIAFGVGPRKKLWWHGDPHNGMKCLADGLLKLELSAALAPAASPANDECEGCKNNWPVEYVPLSGDKPVKCHVFQPDVESSASYDLCTDPKGIKKWLNKWVKDNKGHDRSAEDMLTDFAASPAPPRKREK